ncbi:MAG: FAD-dependent oxidoreductase [Planctomycetes bacterium]|nr:FAD-dependent oxidoreductase [Planctomycetota bacterium]
MAGLAAGYELDRAGYDVNLLEAQSRPGGRVFTQRDPFADGLYAEMGAEYVDAKDEYVHQLPKAFARKLSDRILYRRPVRRIAHDASGAEVWFEENGELRSLRAPHLVVTIPFSVLRHLEIAPAFSPAKMKVIRELAYGQVMKMAMQYGKRFWDEPGSIGQRVFTDTKLRRVYHMSVDQPGPRGILMSFTSGSDAADLGTRSHEDRLRAALADTARIWPEAPRHWEGAAVKYWNEDPWVRASYSFLGVGQAADFLAIAKCAEGRVHFAGEHTAMGGMDGAIASGLRAPEKIKKAGGL